MAKPPLVLPYSKAMDPKDFEQLTLELEAMCKFPHLLDGQHEVRKWEYAMALRTIIEWRIDEQGAGRRTTDDPLEILDVGGAGSHFWQLLTTQTTQPILVVDPNAPDRVWRDGEPVQYWKETIAAFAGRVALDQFDVITAISVVEHVPAPEVRMFLRACKMLLKPGGLLFLTTDYAEGEGPDVYHFHWMRERIYHAGTIRKLLQSARELGFRSYGAADWTYRGAQVYDYSVVSAAIRRHP